MWCVGLRYVLSIGASMECLLPWLIDGILALWMMQMDFAVIEHGYSYFYLDMNVSWDVFRG